MPYKSYDHNCPCASNLVFVEICPECHNQGELTGWGLSVVENWCLYVRKTGFGPFGSHRHLLDLLFYEYWEYCPDCDGVGVIDAENNLGYENCLNCDHKGGFYTGESRDWNRMIYEVISAYPDSIGAAYQEEYNEIYKKYKYELENPKPVLTNEDIANSHNRNGGGIFDVK